MIFEKLLKNPDGNVDIIQHMKKLIKARKKFYEKYQPSEHGLFSARLKKEDGWSKDRTIRKIFEIPSEVYYANKEYWDEVIRTKDYKKHPEWMVGTPTNKFVK